MKKTFFIIGLLAVFNISFAKLNDNLKIFSQDEKIKVESKITELEDKRKLHIYVNTLPTDEGFSVEDPEKIIILNIKKDDSGKGKIELSFSKDINVEEYQDGINLVLENAENTLSKGEAGNYAIEVLDGIDGVLDKVNIELLKQTGAHNVVTRGKNLQVIYGPTVNLIRTEIDEYISTL